MIDRLLKGEIIDYQEWQGESDEKRDNTTRSILQMGFRLVDDGTSNGYYVEDLPDQVKLCNGAELKVSDVDVSEIQTYFEAIGYTLVVRVEPKYLEEN